MAHAAGPSPRVMVLVGAFVVVAGVALWRYYPTLAQAAPGWFSNDPQLPDVSSSLKSLDKSGAQFIRRLAAGEVKPLESISEKVTTSVSDATISATLSTTPERVWQAYQTEGVSGALGELGGTAQVQVGNVSAAAAEEARYQYCLGVVESYQSKKNE